MDVLINGYKSKIKNIKRIKSGKSVTFDLEDMDNPLSKIDQDADVKDGHLYPTGTDLELPLEPRIGADWRT